MQKIERTGFGSDNQTKGNCLIILTMVQYLPTDKPFLFLEAKKDLLELAPEVVNAIAYTYWGIDSLAYLKGQLTTNSCFDGSLYRMIPALRVHAETTKNGLARTRNLVARLPPGPYNSLITKAPAAP